MPKVYCIECAHYLSGVFGVGKWTDPHTVVMDSWEQCETSIRRLIPASYLMPERESSVRLVPKEDNANNDCKYFEAKGED